MKSVTTTRDKILQPCLKGAQLFTIEVHILRRGPQFPIPLLECGKIAQECARGVLKNQLLTAFFEAHI